VSAEPKADGQIVKHLNNVSSGIAIIERRIERGRQSQHANNANERSHSKTMAQKSYHRLFARAKETAPIKRGPEIGGGPMSALGQKQTNHRGSKSTVVRCYPICRHALRARPELFGVIAIIVSCGHSSSSTFTVDPSAWIGGDSTCFVDSSFMACTSRRRPRPIGWFGPLALAHAHAGAAAVFVDEFDAGAFEGLPDNNHARRGSHHLGSFCQWPERQPVLRGPASQRIASLIDLWPSEE